MPVQGEGGLSADLLGTGLASSASGAVHSTGGGHAAVQQLLSGWV